MKDEIQQYIDNNIVENPNIELSKLSVLTTPRYADESILINI